MNRHSISLSLLASALPLSLCLPAACGSTDGDSAPEEPTADAPAALALASPVINREIPIRFVQFIDGTNDALGITSLNEQIAGANAIFAKAGVRFSLAGTTNVTSSAFVVLDANYTWPSPASAAPPVAFKPGCSPNFLSGTQTDEEMALFQGASYCGDPREILVYTVRSSPQAEGAYPWEANAVFIPRSNMGAGNRTFAHELGHYLGLSHSFRGAGLAYDLTNANLKNPQTGGPAALADFWDLVYKPADLPPATAGNVYFNSRAEAASYPGSSLRAIQGNAGWAQNPLGFACFDSLDNCPPVLSDRTFRLAVPRSGAEYADCNQVEPAFSQQCLCVTNPAACDVLFTGDSGLKGLGLTLPGHTPTAPKLGANVMSYNYNPGYGGDQWALSDSQVEQIKRVLKYETPSGWLAGVVGNRPQLGIGAGWTDWEHIAGGVQGRPAVTAKASGQLDLIARGSDSGLSNKVLNPGSPPVWWPSQLGRASLGGATAQSPDLVRRGDYLSAFVVGTGGDVFHKVWDPNLDGWWPSQTGWDQLGGPVSAPPVSVARNADTLDVFAWAQSNKIVHQSWSTATSQWSPSQSGWNDLGTMGAAPTVESWGPDRIDLVALDSNKQAHNKVYESSVGWWPSTTGWQNLGSKQFAESPAVVSWSPGRLDVIGRGVDGRAYNKVWEPSSWSPSVTSWYDMGGSLAGPISATSSGVGRLEVVARSTDGRLLYKVWSSGNWWPGQTEWATLAVDIAGDPVVVSSGPGKIDVFVVGTDGTLWHRSRNINLARRAGRPHPFGAADLPLALTPLAASAAALLANVDGEASAVTGGGTAARGAGGKARTTGGIAGGERGRARRIDGAASSRDALKSAHARQKTEMRVGHRDRYPAAVGVTRLLRTCRAARAADLHERPGSDR